MSYEFETISGTVTDGVLDLLLNRPEKRNAITHQMTAELDEALDQAELDPDVRAVALRGAEPDVQDKILRNMSKRAAEILKDDMEARGPVKLTDVEAAQKEIVVIAQRLAEEGTISLGGKGGGEFV